MTHASLSKVDSIVQQILSICSRAEDAEEKGLASLVEDEIRNLKVLSREVVADVSAQDAQTILTRIEDINAEELPSGMRDIFSRLLAGLDSAAGSTEQ